MEKKNNPNWILRIGVLGVILLVIYMFWTTPSETTDPKMDAYTAATIEVKNYLKSPSTAEFQPYNASMVTPLSEDTYTVSGYVDAQNSYGATTRSTFIVKVKGSGYKWQTEALVLDNKKMK